MTARAKTLLENLLLEAEARTLKNSHFISREQFTEIKSQLPVPKTNSNLLVRFGFFILGVLLYSSLTGVISLFTLGAIDSAYEILVFFYAAIGLAGAEFFARNNFHAHGLDDAFILGFQLSLCGAIGIATENTTIVFAAMAIAGLFCCIRYVHTISSIVSMVGIAGTIATLLTELHLIDTMFLPFVMLLLAVGLYFLYDKLKENPALRFYHNGVLMVQIFSLVLGYLSVNYLVVREMSQELMGIVITGNNDIPLAWLFYCLTFIIPISYIAYSLAKKDRTILIIGLLAFAFSIFTIRFYYSLMPPETALILGGVVLFTISILCIRKLKHRETGITFKKDRHADSESLAYAQAIIVNSQANIHAPQSPDPPMTFGGGGFSGGGAGESF